MGSEFAETHGDAAEGIIAESEYDKLFEHLAEALGRVGTFAEGAGSGADFSGYRYVDQIPWITIVPSDDVPPSRAAQAAFEAINSAHRPFAVSFDFYPDALLILPQRRVFTTFAEEEIRGGD
ncbi:hypothetical protein DES53_11176 [Roseimicrobium gellanilyticum]|uniref:Uncharacterized protein n=2 Tax=Roseimicrobium gellanilyticum TaxID=748857 RepID=A0A366H8K5_9BACT|nr:hypothetical protein DES53_11176 [Roseimicrobium gellanilyticum]